MGHLSVTCICHVYMHGHACAVVPVWESEDTLEESVLCIHHMGPGTQTQVLQISGKCLYPLVICLSEFLQGRHWCMKGSL